MVTSTPTPVTREEIAQIEVGQTAIGPLTIAFLVIFFLASIVAVPLYELAWPRDESLGDAAAPWSHLARMPAEISTRVSASASDSGVISWTRMIAANRAVLETLHTFEEALEDESRLGRMLRPRAQLIMSGWLGAGNERVYAGRDSWLFFRPDVEYITGDGFLSPRSLARRVEIADEWTTPPQPDPLKAIAAFKRHLDARGIILIVMPTPLKPSIHPDKLAARYRDAPLPLQNPSYSALVGDLQRQGVLVFDPASVLVETTRATETSQYLATDTHWRPEAMEAVAEQLVAFVRSHVTLPERSAGYRVEPREVRRLGDIAVMLDLPQAQTFYAPETVSVRRVIAPDGTAWRPARDADVLILGDSFSNIYSLASMGWGDSGGLIEYVSYLLQRPVDRVVQNDQGAYATRELLRRAGEERLAGKRVVIYQFAARELMFGDWKVFE